MNKNLELLMKPVTTIILSGIDSVGKTTLKNAFDKSTNYSYVLFDRGPIDTYTYAKMAQRGNEDGCVATFMQMLPHTLYVVLTASAEAVQSRMDERGEGELMKGTTLQSNLDAFDAAYEFFKHLGDDRVIKIDSSNAKVEECVQKIRHAIDIIKSKQEVGDTIEHQLDHIFMPDDYLKYGKIDQFKGHPKDWTYIESKTGKTITNIYYDFVALKIDKIVKDLKHDKHSRQGIINYSYMFEFPCVVYSSHRIRNNDLITTVHCRSSDIERGFVFDLAFNSWIHKELARRLNVGEGHIRVVSDSLHQYNDEKPWIA